MKRYNTHATDDGLAPGEGAFLACSFWLADAYVSVGRQDDADKMLERLLSIRNDLGLLAEEYDTANGRLIVAGWFKTINGLASQAHLASLSMTTGAPLPWASHPKYEILDITRPTVRLHLEVLESRLAPYAVSGNLWPHPNKITISFVPDGTNLGGVTSNLLSTWNARFGSATAWQTEILRAAVEDVYGTATVTKRRPTKAVATPALAKAAKS